MLLHSAFYRFVPLASPHTVAQQLREQAGDALTGSLLVAHEGLNGAVAGTPEAVRTFEAALLRDPAFAGMPFKHSSARTAPYARLKVHVKPELVALGIPGVTGLPGVPDPLTLAPAAWRTLLADERLVLIDNRNSFEYRLGHFRGAIDPGVLHFRDFAAWLAQRLPAWQAEGRPVAMYCTGGIRCEKLGPWLRERQWPVYQLDGGILHYCEQLPDAAREWQGECFVFDNRIALDSRLQETATTAEQVYDPNQADEGWRLARARRLAASVT